MAINGLNKQTLLRKKTADKILEKKNLYYFETYYIGIYKRRYINIYKHNIHIISIYKSIYWSVYILQEYMHGSYRYLQIAKIAKLQPSCLECLAEMP